MVSDEIRGMEIFNFAGKKVGTVLYPLWTCKSRKIDGLVLIKNKFFQYKFFLNFSCVDRFENGCIYLIKNYKTRKSNMDIPIGKALVNNKEAYISNYTFDEKTGSVKSVEIAKSIYEDIQYKRKEYESFQIVNGQIIIEEEKR